MSSPIVWQAYTVQWIALQYVYVVCLRDTERFRYTCFSCGAPYLIRWPQDLGCLRIKNGSDSVLWAQHSLCADIDAGEEVLVEH